MWFTVWAIVRHELRRIFSDRAVLVFGLGLPVVIIVLVGSIFGTTGTIDLGVIDKDESAASQALVRRLDHLDGVAVKRYTSEATLRRDVRSSARDAGVVVPHGFGGRVAAGRATVDLAIDPSSDRVAVAVAAVRGVVAAEGVEDAAVQVVDELVGDPAAARRMVASVAEGVTPVGVGSVGERADGSVKVGSFSYTAPSNLVLFVFVMTFAVSTILANDRKQGLIRRMLSTPNTTGTVLLGIGATRFLFALTQSFLIVGIGGLVLGVRWGDPLGAVALVILFAMVSTAFGLLVGSWVVDAEQAQAVGIPIAIALGMLGGCMWPTTWVPDAMRILGHVAPHAWAMDAWTQLIFEAGSLRDILPELAVLVAITVAVGWFAARRLRASVFG